MTQKTFDLIDAVNREGIENHVWGMLKDCNTKYMFGSIENIDLEGMYLYVYKSSVEYFSFINTRSADIVLHFCEEFFDKDSCVYLFKLE